MLSLFGFLLNQDDDPITITYAEDNREETNEECEKLNDSITDQELAEIAYTEVVEPVESLIGDFLKRVPKQHMKTARDMLHKQIMDVI